MVDEQTFVEEAQAMERTLYRVARSYLPGWEQCADAVQEALTKVWAKRSTAKPEYFRAWMTRIVINECHNLSRQRITPIQASRAANRLPFTPPMPLSQRCTPAGSAPISIH